MNSLIIVRWTARLLSAGLVGLFVLFFVGEGPPPFWPLSAHTLSLAALCLCLAGLAIAWRAERLGGWLGLAGSVGFYAIDFVLSGYQRFPSGPVFPFTLVVPILFLLASWLERRPRSAAVSPA
jgi:hypothetical protein